jgi:hypothetical protein
VSEQSQQYQSYEPRQDATLFDDSSETQLDLHVHTVPKYNAEAIQALRSATKANRARTEQQLQAERVLRAGSKLMRLHAERRMAQGLDPSSKEAA